jgi:RIO kinase 1
VGQNRVNEELADLDAFVETGQLDEVIGVVKSGKEATVYSCRAGPALGGARVAAKVYRSRKVRQFANAAVYNAGRLRQPYKREARAIMTRTRFGQEQAFARWVADEWATLRLLHGAGVSVPEPLLQSDRIIIMEFIGDDDGAAPLLADVDLEPEEARDLFDRLIDEIGFMLSRDRVHADLSPYNVLYHDGRGRIIDVPQAVDARFNPNALDLLDRDVERICRWATEFGIESDPWRISRGLWARYLRADL